MAAKPVYALVGSDAFVQLQKLAEVLGALPPDVQRTDLDGERAELAEALDELRGFAMFGGGKVVVIRNAGDFISQHRAAMEAYLQHPSDSATLVLRFDSLAKTTRIYKQLAKLGAIETCDPPKDARGWVVKQARAAHGLTMEPAAAAMLVDMIGADLGRLDSELAKLALAVEGGRIDAASIANSVSFQREREMWDMTNELASGQTTEALRRWRQLVALDPSTEFRAVTWLGMWLEDVGVVLRGKVGRGPGPGKLAWKYKDRMNQFLRTCDRLGPAGHARALDLLTRIDLQSKTGVGDASANVERFILDLANTP